MSDELLSILIAVRDAPKECGNCVAFCQEGHVDIPCKGTFDCEDREEIRKEAKEKANGNSNQDTGEDVRGR